MTTQVVGKDGEVKRYDLVGVNAPNSYTMTCGKCQMVEADDIGVRPNVYQYVLACDYDQLKLENERLREALEAAELAVKALDDTGFYVEARTLWRDLTLEGKTP